MARSAMLHGHCSTRGANTVSKSKGVRRKALDEDLDRKTPRSLGHTLRALRTTGKKQSRDEWAKSIHVHPNTLKKWERPDDVNFELSIQDVQRYQDLLGIPVGIIVCISHVLSAARDNQPKQLEALRHMLGALYAKLESPERRIDAIKRISQNPTDLRRWDTLLSSLILRVYADDDISTDLLEAWRNPNRLANHERRRAERVVAHDEKLKNSRSKKAPKKATAPRTKLKASSK